MEKGGIELLLKVLKFHSMHGDFVALGLRVLHVLALDHVTVMGEGVAGQPHAVSHRVLNSWFELCPATGEPYIQDLWDAVRRPEFNSHAALLQHGFALLRLVFTSKQYEANVDILESVRGYPMAAKRINGLFDEAAEYALEFLKPPPKADVKDEAQGLALEAKMMGSPGG